MEIEHNNKAKEAHQSKDEKLIDRYPHVDSVLAWNIKVLHHARFFALLLCCVLLCSSKSYVSEG